MVHAILQRVLTLPTEKTIAAGCLESGQRTSSAGFRIGEHTLERWIVSDRIERPAGG
jgi:hypothetical protein